ncbi:MAG: TonB-dependent receptor [Proteobacteria bacterium]|nr:TonB-dependent receptor [Pseudomonadota bacterium]
MAGDGSAPAQTALPEIVVNAPSPIMRRGARVPSAPLPVALEPRLANGPPIIADTFVPVTVVTGAEIARNAAATIGDLLFARPGMTATTFAPGAASRPVIRGLDSYRVRMQENGIGLHDVSNLSEDHAVAIDPMVAQNIEIIRGPATLRYGSEAIGGVVEASNNRIPAHRFATPGLAGMATGGLASADSARDGALLLDGGGGNFALHLDAHARRGGDYRIPGGRQDNSRLHARGQSGGATYFFDDGYFGAALTRFTSLYHIPGLTSAPINSRIDLDQTRLAGKGEWRPANTGIVDVVRLWLGATNYRHHERARDDLGADGVRSTFRNREQEARAEVELLPWQTRIGRIATAVGMHIGRQRLATAGESGELLAPNGTERVAGYLFNELTLAGTPFRLQSAGRVEHARIFGAGAIFPADLRGGGDDPLQFDARRRFTPVSASIGALAALPWHMNASLTAQYVERAPRAPELFSKGPHDATRTFEIGNADLGKEAAKTIEVGLKRARGRLRFEANAYHTQYKGFIFRRVTGLRCDDDFAACGTGTELTQVAFTQRDATFTGGEFSAQVDVMPLGSGRLGIDGQYDIVRARFANGTYVPRIPPQRAGMGVWWRDANWLMRVGYLHGFAQNRPAPAETRTPGYDLLKAEVSFTHTLPGGGFGPREITMGIVGDNLLNDDVRNHVMFRKDEILLPGRTIRGFARLAF